MFRALRNLISPPSKRTVARTKARLHLEALESRMTPSGFGGAFGTAGTGDHFAIDLAADAAGNTYVTGEFRGTVDLDPAHLNPSAVLSFSPVSGFVAKYDSAGAFVWAVNLGGARSYDLAFIDAFSDAVLVTGEFTGTRQIGDFNMISAGQVDAFVVRLDAATGHVTWANQWGGAYDDRGFGVAFDEGGNAFCTGGLINLDSTGLGTTIDAFVIKYSPDGTKQWDRRIGGDYYDQGNSVATDSLGNVIVGGEFAGTVDFNPSSTASYNLTSGGSGAGFVLKLNSSGNFVWADHFQAGGTWSHSAVGTVLVNSQNNVFAVGGFDGRVDFNPDKKATFNASGTNDAFAVKLNASGQYVWAKTFGSANNPMSFSLWDATLDGAGNLYMTGSFYGTADFDPGKGVFSRTSAGSEDMFVMKLNTNGGFEWAVTCGATEMDRGNGIAVDGSGNIYVVGMFKSVVDFDPFAGNYLLDAGLYDAMFWLKLTP